MKLFVDEWGNGYKNCAFRISYIFCNATCTQSFSYEYAALGIHDQCYSLHTCRRLKSLWIFIGYYTVCLTIIFVVSLNFQNARSACAHVLLFIFSHSVSFSGFWSETEMNDL